ncbi:MAG: response regulator [Anaerolineaceae bacterium]|nr:response regulator [Anaerolineaceae bacterium]
MNNTESWIMIIDDDISDLELIERAFSLVVGKNKLICMNSSREALAYLQGEGEFSDRATNPYPSMLITDIKMPGVDGFEILENLQNNPSRAIIPAMVLSSSEDPDDIQTAYRLGAYSYFVKPYRYEDMCNLANILIQYWKSNKAPLKDENGKQMMTDSKGKLGARYSVNN